MSTNPHSHIAASHNATQHAYELGLTTTPPGAGGVAPRWVEDVYQACLRHTDLVKQPREVLQRLQTDRDLFDACWAYWLLVQDGGTIGSRHSSYQRLGEWLAARVLP